VSGVFNLLDADLGEPVEVGSFRHRRVSVREALGGEQFGSSLYELAPGERMWPYHYHLGNEEWLIVVSGRPTLRTPEGERVLAPGEVVGFVDGEAGAHTLSNERAAPARVVLFSTLRYGNAVYPDSDKIGAGPGDDRRYFRRSDAVDYIHGE
jgi:uncharacterized cupin superfamily protein